MLQLLVMMRSVPPRLCKKRVVVVMRSVPPRGRDCVNTPKSHPRKWVECSDPTYRATASRSENPTNGSWWMVQIQPVRSVGSQMKRNSPMYTLSRLVSEAGSEQSTNCRWWDSKFGHHCL